MDIFDFVIIGAGPAGEAAAYKAADAGASVAIDRPRWFGGSLPAHRLHPVEVAAATPPPGTRRTRRRTTGPGPRPGATT